MMEEIRRGDIVMAELSSIHSVQGGIRPVIVIQNNIGNKFSPTTIVVPLTSEIKKLGQPTHEIITTEDATGLKMNSMALCEQIQTIDKRNIGFKVASISNTNIMDKISNAVKVALEI